MFRISTNKTEESWARNDIKKAKPSEDSNEILERINKLSTEGMSYETAIDFFKLQLATWRRFYKAWQPGLTGPLPGCYRPALYHRTINNDRSEVRRQ